jgi:hypothetical protein
MSFLLAERGETGGIEDAYVAWNEVAGAPSAWPWASSVWPIPSFRASCGLEYQDYAIYRTRVGNTPAALMYDRGVLLSTDVLGFALAGAVVNGNGTGAGSVSRRFDDDRHKSLVGYVSRDVTNGVTLGALGYVSRHVTTVHAEDELLVRGDHPHQPLVPWRQRDRQGGRDAADLGQDAHESHTVGARGLRSKRVLPLQAEEIAAVAQRYDGGERESPQQLGAEFTRDPGCRTTNVPAAPTFTTS